MQAFRAFLYTFLFANNCLSLAELWCATSGFETVFLSFLHSRVTGQVAGFFEDRSVLRICLEQSAGDAVADRSGLSGVAASVYVDKNIKLICRICRNERLTNYNLQCLQTQIIIDISFIYGNFTCSRY